MSRIPEYTNKATLDGTELFHIVDPSDTTDDPTGSSFHATAQAVADLGGGYLAYVDASGSISVPNASTTILTFSTINDEGGGTILDTGSDNAKFYAPVDGMYSFCMDYVFNGGSGAYVEVLDYIQHRDSGGALLRNHDNRNQRQYGANSVPGGQVPMRAGQYLEVKLEHYTGSTRTATYSFVMSYLHGL